MHADASCAVDDIMVHCILSLPRNRYTDTMCMLAEMDTLIGTLKDAGLCKDVHYKELYIPQAELEGKVFNLSRL